MLREFRAADADRYFALLTRSFPEEQALLGYRPAAFDRIVRRVFRWDARLLLGLLDLLHRPVVRFPVVEADGQLIATAVLTFTPRAGYIGSVMVDAGYRRRGHARRLVERCLAEARRAGRRYAVLDVLRSNAPARALYDRLGFRPLRAQAYYLRPESAPLPPAGPTPGVRPYARRDARGLRDLASAVLPPAVAEVLPATRGQFSVPELVVRGLDSTSAAWVLDGGAGPVGFVRATVSEAMDAANLTAPLLAASVGPDAGRTLVEAAVRWVDGQGGRRAVTMVPEDQRSAIAAVTAAGFAEAFGLETLYRDVPG